MLAPSLQWHVLVLPLHVLSIALLLWRGLLASGYVCYAMADGWGPAHAVGHPGPRFFTAPAIFQMSSSLSGRTASFSCLGAAAC